MSGSPHSIIAFFFIIMLSRTELTYRTCLMSLIHITYLLQSVSELPVNTLLPSSSDRQAMLYNFSILVSQILVTELPFFSDI